MNPKDTKKQPATIDTVAKTCIAARLRLLNRVITKIYDDALRPVGVKISQCNILVMTAKMGTALPTLVCEMLQLDLSTLSRNVELMRTKGWLEVVPSEDARTHPFRLTDTGRRLVEKVIPAWEKAQAQARTLLGEDFVSLLGPAVRNASSRAGSEEGG
jgi:DNA-binding MarR family transcriptional regulator